jgi:hypothetical protein
MREMIFEAMYGEGGTAEPSEAEFNAYFGENYLRFRAIEVNIDDADDEESVTEAEEYANDYAERLEAGELFSMVLEEHEALMMEKYLAQMAEDEHDNDDSDDSDDSGENSGDVIPEDEDEAIEEEEIDENTADIIENIDFLRHNLPEELLDYVLTLDVGSAGVYRLDDVFVVLHRLDVLERADWLEDNKTRITFGMMNDVLRELIRERALAFNIVPNDAAIKRYKVERAVPRENLI